LAIRTKWSAHSATSGVLLDASVHPIQLQIAMEFVLQLHRMVPVSRNALPEQSRLQAYV
jgi:hypothetical protein